MLTRRNDRRARTGVAAAELALLIPILAYLLMAVIDFARLSFNSITITTCAHNGAIWACDPSTQSQSPYKTLTAAAQADAANLSPLPDVDPLKYCATPDGTYTTTVRTTGYIEVTVNWTFKTLVAYPGIPSTSKLSRFVRMRILPAS